MAQNGSDYLPNSSESRANTGLAIAGLEIVLRFSLESFL